MPRTRTKTIFAILLLAVASFGAFMMLKLRLPKPAIANATGKPVPQFVLRDQNDKDFAIASEHGHKVLLMFYRGYW